jgi:LytTr DNA-binding domain
MPALVSAVREYVYRHWRSHVVAAAAGVFLALVGALGTGAAPWLDRLVFWTALLQSGSLFASAVGVAASRRPRVGESVVLRWAVTTVAVAVPMALLSWGLARVVFAGRAPVGMAFFAWASFLVTGAMTALMMAIATPGRATQRRQYQPADVKLRERLALPFPGAEIYAVSAEDHYLRVHTSAGATLILMRLVDALAELEGIEGAQVHRSWWVARAAIVGSKRFGRKMALSLKGEIEAPVSRPNAKALQDSGWLA